MAIPYSRYMIGSITWYSILIISGILMAYYLGSREEKRLGLHKDTMLDVVLVAVPFGIIGSRIYYVLMTLDEFITDPVSMLYIWNGGVAIYGAVIGGAVSVYVYSRIKKIPFTALLDIVAPGLVLAQAIGRWGNYFNREAYGPEITNAFWQFFPAGVLISENGTDVWHVATFFYESMWNLSVFATLWLLRKRMKRRGDTFLWYMVLYGCGRFLVEQLRQDSLYLLGMRVSQMLSLLLCITVASIFLWRLFKQTNGKVFAAYLLVSILAFTRPLFSGILAGNIMTAVLYIIVLSVVMLYAKEDKPLLIWIAADAVIYLALWITGVKSVWQSPYFIYTGISVAFYLFMIYRTLKTEASNAGLKA